MKTPQKAIIAICLLIGVAILASTAYLLNKPSGTITRTSGKALIGGPFTMINQDGKTVTEKDLKGKYALIYFGYTFCPDVCPTELQVITGALEQLGDGAKNIQPVFVSVDPERDSVAVVKEYVSNFYPGMIGLTGSAKQVAAMARTYRVYYSKVVEKGAEPDEYTMDHSSITYLMGPNGSFVKHFAYGTDAKALAKGIKAATKG